MNHLEDILYIASLALIAAVSLAAIFHPRFEDNTLQRLGLVGMCFGAALRVVTYIQGSDLPGLRYALTYGMAIYAMGTVLKFWKFNRVEKAARPLRRRVTDLQGDQP